MSDTNNKKVKSSDLELKDRLVALNRVTKVTKGGRTFTFAAIVVVGNENGVVGHGLGKAKEVQEAIAKGIDDAKKNLVKVPVLLMYWPRLLTITRSRAASCCRANISSGGSAGSARSSLATASPSPSSQRRSRCIARY